MPMIQRKYILFGSDALLGDHDFALASLSYLIRIHCLHFKITKCVDLNLLVSVENVLRIQKLPIDRLDKT